MGLFDTPQLLNVQTADGTALTAAAEGLLLPVFRMPARFMKPGRTLHVILFGKASNAVTTPGTLTLRARWGGLTGTVLGASAALTQNVIVQDDKSWMWEMWITARSLTSFITYGRIIRGNAAAAVVADMTPDLFPASGLAAVTVDQSAESSLAFTAESSVTTASIICLASLVRLVTGPYHDHNGGGEFLRYAGL